MWQNAPRFDENRGTTMTWVMTLAHRRAVDRVRTARVTTTCDAAYAVRNMCIEFDSVAAEVELRLKGEAVRAALSVLTPRQREAITLAYFGGLTYRQVAERLDEPAGTIKTRIRDGLLRLRDSPLAAT
ncbi:sigma-70 family RNA polymerase sigma factor [Sporichthya sp.]|uniref:sigma-70 family RNA polymerase sigma factor n=1 Tax=Sporichthya sp. TaxID=65475 RepID=UPI0025D24CF0|nr:sigma-70 family RNA polymerase sigma factor [Sporichthya sp.]